MSSAFRCVFDDCKDTKTTFSDIKAFNTHLQSSHGFEKGRFLVTNIKYKKKDTKLLLPYTNECPIGGCNAGPQEFASNRIGSHIKVHPSNDAWEKKLEAGVYFWWHQSITQSHSLEDCISRAFTDPNVRRRALVLFDSSLDHLDENDDALIEFQNQNEEEVDNFEMINTQQVYDHEFASVTRSLSQVAIEDDSVNEVNMDIQEPLSSVGFVDVPGLQLPPALAVHDFAILAIMQLPNSPKVFVCLKCRRIVDTKSHGPLQEHRKTCTDQGPPPAQDMDDNAADGPEMVIDVENDRDPEDQSSDSDSEPVGANETKVSTAKAWAKARAFLASGDCVIDKLTVDRPPQIGPPNPFFDVVNGYKCSFCVKAFVQKDSARRHVQSEHKQDTRLLNEHDPYPACKMQSYGGRNTPYFQVTVDELPPPTLELCSPETFMRQSLQLRASGAVRQNDRQLSELSQRSPMIKRFRYDKIYPKEIEKFSEFVNCRAPAVSASHSDDQPVLSQLVALVSLLYHLEGQGHLSNTEELLKRQLGSKGLSGLLSGQPSGSETVFKPLQRYSSVVSPEHKTTGQALHASITQALKSQQLSDALTSLKTVATDDDPLSPVVTSGAHIQSPLLLDICHSVMDAFHQFSFALVAHPDSLRPEQEVLATPVQRFIALKAWNPHQKVFQDVTSLHGQLAQIQWTMRMVIFCEHRRMAKQDEERRPYDILCELKDQCGVRDQTTPFGQLQEQMRYASQLKGSQTVVPDATFNRESQTAYLNHVVVPVNQFQEMLQSLLTELDTCLDNELLFGRREKVFDFVDEKGLATFRRPQNPIEAAGVYSEGYSYFDANECFSSKKDSLIKLVISELDLQKRFLLPVTNAGQYYWNLSQIKSWVIEVDRFKSLLACLTYWLSGMPPRGTEFTSTRIRNTAHMPRNIKCSQGDLVIEHTYTKSESMTGFGRAVMRMPAYPLQRLLEEYIVVIKPLYDIFMQKLLEEGRLAQPQYSSLLWTIDGNQMSTRHLSESLARYSHQHLHHSITIRMWRQLLIQLGANILPKEIVQLPHTTTALTAQASHGAAAERTHYNRQTGFASEVLSATQCAEFKSISLAWAEALGFPHPTHRSSPLDAPHGSQVVRFDYDHLGRVIAKQVVNTLEEKDRQKAVASHLSEIQARELNPLPRVSTPLNIVANRLALQALQAVAPSIRHFRSPEQGACIQYVLDQATAPLFVVHPMGHGKSAVYLGPVLLEKGMGKTTVVLFPLLALAQAATLKATTLGLRCYFLNPQEVHRETLEGFDLLLMTYDLLINSPTVFQTIQTIANQGQLTRIVVDEAHTIITDRTYRESFRQLHRRLANIPVPQIFMSGTMPQAILQELMSAFGAHPTIYESRIWCDKPNMAYRVDWSLLASPKTVIEIAKKIQEELIPMLERDPHQRAIVFARTIDWAHQIATHAGTRVYTSEADLSERQNGFVEWYTDSEQLPNQRVMISTSALSLGIDYPNITHIWIFGDPYDSLTLCQMAARGGRTGSISHVRLFPSKWIHEKEVQDDVLLEFKNTTKCRRTPLALYLDGRRITCLMLPAGSALCDNCMLNEDATLPSLLPDPTLLFAVQQAASTKDADMRLTVQALYDTIAILCVRNDLCPFCMLVPGKNAQPHSAANCPTRLFESVHALSLLTREIRMAGPDQGMDKHLDHIKDDKCLLGEFSHCLLLGLLASEYHAANILQQIPGRKPEKVLEAILSPVVIYPCDAVDTGRQLLNYHFLLLSAVVKTEYAPQSAHKVVSKNWFQRWSIPPTSKSIKLFDHIPWSETTSNMHNETLNPQTASRKATTPTNNTTPLRRSLPFLSLSLSDHMVAPSEPLMDWSADAPSQAAHAMASTVLPMLKVASVKSPGVATMETAMFPTHDATFEMQPRLSGTSSQIRAMHREEEMFKIQPHLPGASSQLHGMHREVPEEQRFQMQPRLPGTSSQIHAMHREEEMFKIQPHLPGANSQLHGMHREVPEEQRFEIWNHVGALSNVNLKRWVSYILYRVFHDKICLQKGCKKAPHFQSNQNESAIISTLNNVKESIEKASDRGTCPHCLLPKLFKGGVTKESPWLYGFDHDQCEDGNYALLVQTVSLLAYPEIRDIIGFGAAAMTSTSAASFLATPCKVIATGTVYNLHLLFVTHFFSVPTVLAPLHPADKQFLDKIMKTAVREHHTTPKDMTIEYQTEPQGRGKPVAEAGPRNHSRKQHYLSPESPLHFRDKARRSAGTPTPSSSHQRASYTLPLTKQKTLASGVLSRKGMVLSSEQEAAFSFTPQPALTPTVGAGIARFTSMTPRSATGGHSHSRLGEKTTPEVSNTRTPSPDPESQPDPASSSPITIPPQPDLPPTYDVAATAHHCDPSTYRPRAREFVYHPYLRESSLRWRSK
ncbi:hypothetical protein M408DRAFT_311304 [Serendipita vermifera MAFF 305830]|uniref:DNA 3'-5' helicase n=1 Tax=Serendipita vermifera MAFF 305830 TaxID=933852 RepID=A0A0C3B7J2_SERVB|nr:hypothetical protein M408DRAFT_311304 [Serendipita vermifera MAFF 305830]